MSKRVKIIVTVIIGLSAIILSSILNCKVGIFGNVIITFFTCILVYKMIRAVWKIPLNNHELDKTN